MADRSDRITAAALVLAASLVTYTASLTWGSVVDDAWISARYAAHIAAGNGVTFNAQGPAIEGITNLAWTFLLALGLALGLDAHDLMVWMGWSFALATLVAVTGLTRALTGRRDEVTLLPALLLAMFPHFAVVATNGLETTMMMAAVTATVWAWLALEGRLRWWAGATGAALIWVRPEGLAVCALLGLFDLLRNLRPRGVVGAFIATLPFAAPALASQVALTAWRLAYYGEWLPNTWYAKNNFPITETFAQNGKYFGPESTVLYALLGAWVVAALAPPWHLRKAALAATALLLALIPLQVNEWMPGLRLFEPSVALTACLVAAAVASLPGRRATLASGPILVLIGLLAWSSGERARDYDGRHTMQRGSGASLAAAWLADHVPPGSTLATRDAGVLAFFVGTHVEVMEMHQRALTQPHPGGRDAAVLTYVPRNPEMFISTVRTADQPEFEYGNERQFFDRLTEPYTYLGRVNQHYRRFYDVYVRSDLGVPPLPEELVVSRAGPTPGTPRPSRKEARPAENQEP